LDTRSKSTQQFNLIGNSRSCPIITITVDANASDSVTGKIISPQSIDIEAAEVWLIGKEAELFRFTVKHSFNMLFLLSIITFVHAYLMTWIVPEYKIIETVVVSQVSDNNTRFTNIFNLLAALATNALTVVMLIGKTKRLINW
jgi:lactate permease